MGEAVTPYNGWSNHALQWVKQSGMCSKQCFITYWKSPLLWVVKQVSQRSLAQWQRVTQITNRQAFLLFLPLFSLLAYMVAKAERRRREVSTKHASNSTLHTVLFHHLHHNTATCVPHTFPALGTSLFLPHPSPIPLVSSVCMHVWVGGCAQHTATQISWCQCDPCKHSNNKLSK